MIKQKVLLKNETTYRFGGACKNFFLLEDKNDLHNFSEFDTFSKYFILGKGSNIAFSEKEFDGAVIQSRICLLYTSPSPRDGLLSRMPSSA